LNEGIVVNGIAFNLVNEIIQNTGCAALITDN